MLRSLLFTSSFAAALAVSGAASGQDAPPSPSTADPASPAPAAADPSPGKRAFATGVAVVPGAVVHGLGHVAKGDPATGRRLMLLELGGIGALGGGLAVLIATGASRRLVLPAAALMIGGGGLFFGSYLADIYGSATLPRDAGTPPLVAPILMSEVGYRYVYDPTFEYRNFFVQSAELRVRRLRLKPEAWHALDDRNERLRGTLGFRLHGPLPSRDRLATSGSYVDLDFAVTRHAYLREAFRITTGEVELRGRYDLVELAPSLRGSFFEGSIGLALASYSFTYSPSAATEANDLLLGSFAYGVYLGRPGGKRAHGEVAAYYNHRRDGYTGGMKSPGLGSGVPGHVGLRGLAFFTPNWGVRAEVEGGSAWVGGASLLYRVDP